MPWHRRITITTANDRRDVVAFGFQHWRGSPSSRYSQTKVMPGKSLDIMVPDAWALRGVRIEMIRLDGSRVSHLIDSAPLVIPRLFRVRASAIGLLQGLLQRVLQWLCVIWAVAWCNIVPEAVEAGYIKPFNQAGIACVKFRMGYMLCIHTRAWQVG